jgi:hypothetical protein
VLFLQLALLGAVMGLAFGLVTSWWLSRLVNDPGMSIVLTFGAAYSCYFVSEELLGASGLLAVVVMGFSMSLIGEHGGGWWLARCPLTTHRHAWTGAPLLGSDSSLVQAWACPGGSAEPAAVSTWWEGHWGGSRAQGRAAV